MPQPERISGGQLWILMVGFQMGSAVLLQRAPVAQQDAWLAILLGTAIAPLVVLVYTGVLRSCPGLTMTEAAQRLLGRWPGTLVALGFSWFAIHLGALVLRDSWEFMVVAVLGRTPPLVFAVVMAGLAWAAARQGLEVIARVGELLVPVLVLLPLILGLVVPGDLDFHRLLPVLGQGPLPVVIGGLDILHFPLAETVLFAMVIPYTKDQKRARRAALWAVLLAGLFLAWIAVLNVAGLGPLATRLDYPTYSRWSAMRIGGFLEGLEGLAIILWFIGLHIKIAICLWTGALGLTQSLRLKDYRPVTGPVAGLMLLLSFWLFPSNVSMHAYTRTNGIPYSLFFEVVIPLLLLVAALIHRLLGHGRGRPGVGMEKP